MVSVSSRSDLSRTGTMSPDCLSSSSSLCYKNKQSSLVVFAFLNTSVAKYLVHFGHLSVAGLRVTRDDRYGLPPGLSHATW